MAIRLNPEQERRINALVEAGTFQSPDDFLNSALDSAESAVPPGWEGTKEELDALLLDGLNSGEPSDVDEAYWKRLREKTDQMVVEHAARIQQR